MRRLADAVADREHVDWKRLFAQTRESQRGNVVEALFDLDQLAAQNWPGADVPPFGERPSATASLELSLVLVAALQVSLAFISFFFLQPSTRNVPTFLLLAVGVAFVGGAFGLLRTAPTDDRARYLSLLFTSIASATSILLQPRAGEFLGSIGALTSLMLIETLLPYYLWSFVEVFPKVSRYGPFGRAIQKVRRICLVAGLSLLTLNVLFKAGLASDALNSSAISVHLVRRSTSMYWLAIFLLALPAPFVALQRAREAVPSERRRTLLFILGLCFGIMPLAIGVIAEVISQPFHIFMSQPTARLVGSVVIYSCLLTIPITTSLAVGASFFTIQPVLRRAARYALARSTLMVLSACSLVAFLVFLWLNREESLKSLAVSPIAIFLTCCVALWPLVLVVRPQLVSWLAGPGHSLSAGQSLAEFARSVHMVRDLQELEQLVAQHSKDLFETPSVSLLLRDEEHSLLKPVSDGSTSLREDSLIATLLRNQDGPLRLDIYDKTSPAAWIPESERMWLADSEIGLAIPLVSAFGDNLGALFLERRANLEPYDPEDQRIAQALASTALLGIARLKDSYEFEQSSSAPDTEGTASECRECGAILNSKSTNCECGGDVVPAVVPRMLRGKFRVDKLLGSGGMGRVYLALDKDLQREVALKTLPRLRTRSLVRLRREAQSMASFIHPNLATIFGMETWRGVPILVVEYLPGGTLGDTWAGHLSPMAVVELGVKLATGLDAMHQKGMLHRDVKPSNIGFDSSGEPKLLDFGLASLVDFAGIPQAPQNSVRFQFDPPADRLTATSQLVGTPLYLSPEVLKGNRFSVAEDLWSLHLVLWEALAGHHPLADLDFESAIDSLQAGKIPPIELARPDCPPGLAQLLNTGLSDSRGRPESAAQLHRRLLELLH